MGYFNNIIADSRVSIRAVSPASMAQVSAATTDSPSLPPNPQRLNDAPLSPMVEPLQPRLAEAGAPVRNLPAAPAPAPVSTADSETPSPSVSKSLPPAAQRLSRTAPQTSSAMSSIETAADLAPNAETPQHFMSDMEPHHSPAPRSQHPSAPATPAPMVQRQIQTPDIAGTAPPDTQTASPADRQIIAHPTPTAQGSPQRGATEADTVQAGHMEQAVTPPLPATPEPATTSAAGGRVETAGSRRELQTPAAPVTPSIPAPSTRLRPTPPYDSQRAAPQAPQVRIGQVNVIVEAPAAPRPQSQVTQTDNLSSRLFLRGL